MAHFISYLNNAFKKSKEQGSQKMHQRITDVKMIAFRMKKRKTKPNPVLLGT